MVEEFDGTDKQRESDFQRFRILGSLFIASKLMLSNHQEAIISLLPMFLENAHSVAMIRHALNVVKLATEHVESDTSASNCYGPAAVCPCKTEFSGNGPEDIR